MLLAMTRREFIATAAALPVAAKVTPEPTARCDADLLQGIINRAEREGISWIVLSMDAAYSDGRTQHVCPRSGSPFYVTSQSRPWRFTTSVEIPHGMRIEGLRVADDDSVDYLIEPPCSHIEADYMDYGDGGFWVINVQPEERGHIYRVTITKRGIMSHKPLCR